MGKILLGVIVAVASLMLVDSLSCNKCSFGLVGVCVGPTKETCSSNISVCYTAVTTFPVLSKFSGFNTQGCLDNTTSCNSTFTDSFLSTNYSTQTNCCSSDNCNPIQTSAATASSKMTITATIGAAVLASVWGSLL
ncbi:hypothetical protein EXN66_Car000451 [Channa argus]|uniref:UPAR/Ly6 domain-containing protein n=1 Tax=Channa argus TaxID=215402 RepID=A0A6G1QYI6_CHAAH|nr:hypothetical protein EXN66_Car000451 [Channa argus]KAK2920926.1 hypothetical protein Q8A73_000411 [Channa argus]